LAGATHDVTALLHAWSDGDIAARDQLMAFLDAALTQLSTFDPRKSQIAELRFLAGLSLEETSKALGVSLATVEGDWQTVRA
jgi:DNA-directed RNA polymerase specialized sigma24 family protein